MSIIEKNKSETETHGIQKKYFKLKQNLKIFFTNLFMEDLINNNNNHYQKNDQKVSIINPKPKDSVKMQQQYQQQQQLQPQQVVKTYEDLLKERGYKLGPTLGSGSYAKVKYVVVVIVVVLYL